MVATRCKRDNICCIRGDARLPIEILSPTNRCSVVVHRQTMKCARRHNTRVRHSEWNRALLIEIITPDMDCGNCDSSDLTRDRTESVGNDYLITDIVSPKDRWDLWKSTIRVV